MGARAGEHSTRATFRNTDGLLEPVLAEAFSQRRLTFVEVRTSLDNVLPRRDAKVTPMAARGR